MHVILGEKPAANAALIGAIKPVCQLYETRLMRRGLIHPLKFSISNYSLHRLSGCYPDQKNGRCQIHHKLACCAGIIVTGLHRPVYKNHMVLPAT